MSVYERQGVHQWNGPSIMQRQAIYVTLGLVTAGVWLRLSSTTRGGIRARTGVSCGQCSWGRQQQRAAPATAPAAVTARQRRCTWAMAPAP